MIICCVYGLLHSGNFPCTSFGDYQLLTVPAKAEGSHSMGQKPSSDRSCCLCRYRAKYPEMVVTRECILIHDAFPKAAHHALVLPRDPSLHDMLSLTREHIPLLMQMKVGPPVRSPHSALKLPTWLGCIDAPHCTRRSSGCVAGEHCSIPCE